MAAIPSSTASRSVPSAPSVPVPAPKETTIPPKTAPKTSLEISLTSIGEQGVQKWLRTPTGEKGTIGSFLLLLTEYFQKTFKAQVEIATGLLHIIGPEFWKECCWNTFQAERLKDAAWLALTQTPGTIDVHFRLPFGVATLKDFDRFSQLCAFFYLCGPSSFPQAIGEFGRITTETDLEEAERARLVDMNQLLRSMVQTNGQNIKVELQLPTGSRLRLFVSFPGTPYELENFSLRLQSRDQVLKSELICRVKPLEALTDIIKRLSIGKERYLVYRWIGRSLFNGTDPFPPVAEADVQTPMGRLLHRHPNEIAWTLAAKLKSGLPSEQGVQVVDKKVVWQTADSTLSLPISFPEAALQQFCEWMKRAPTEAIACLTEALAVFCPTPTKLERVQGTVSEFATQIYQGLQGSEAALIWFLGSYGVGWRNIDENDLLDLPRLLSSRAEKLGETLNLLAIAYRTTPYAALFQAINKSVRDATDVHSACLQELMVSGEPKAAAAAWESFKLLEPAARLAVMEVIRTRLTPETFPYAIPRIKELCEQFKRQRKIDLIASYLDHLLGLAEPVRSAYTSVLSDLLNRLLENRPELSERIEAFPRAHAHLNPPQPPEPPKEAPAPVKPDETDQVWEGIQSRSESDLQTFESKLDVFKTKKGFQAFARWAVETLLQQKEYARAMTILGYVTVQRNDHFVGRSYQTALEGLMGQKASLISYVTAWRESGSHLPPEFHTTLFCYLVGSADLKDAAVRKELNYLLDHAAPKGLLDALLIYLPTIEPAAALQIIDKHFNLLKGKSVLKDVVEKLKTTPKETKLWEKLGSILERMQGSPDEVLGIYESLAPAFSIQDSPIQMVCRGIQRLSTPHKDRVAKIVEILWTVAQNEKKQQTFYSYFPSITALLELLQQPETWMTFVRIFLDHRKKVDLKVAHPMILWAAPHVLGSNDAVLIVNFRPAILEIPQRTLQPHAAEWKRMMAGIVVLGTVDGGAQQLIKTMEGLATKEERPFFTDCLQKYGRGEIQILQRRLKSYHETGQVPSPEPVIKPQPTPAPDYALEVSKMLAAENLSEAELEKALTLLEKCPGPEFDLWKKFFSYLKSGQYNLCARGWKSWLAKHPSTEALPEHGEVWVSAVRKAWVEMFNTEIEALDNFVISHLETLLLRLSPEHARSVCVHALLLGINFAWNQQPAQALAKLRALHNLTENQTLKAQIGEPMQLVDVRERFCFYMMAARSADPEIRKSGQAGVFSMILVHGLAPTGKVNATLFAIYSAAPYITRDGFTQETFYSWITAGWELYRSELSWEHTFNLLSILCKFNYQEGVDKAKTTFDPEHILRRWTTVLSESQRPVNSTTLGIALNQAMDFRPVEPLFNMTAELIEKLASIKETEKRAACLISLNVSLKFYISKFHSNSQKMFAELLIKHADYVLRDSDCCAAVLHDLIDIAFDDVLGYLPLVEKWGDECSSLAGSFILNLPRLMVVCAKDPKLMEKLLRIVVLLMHTEQIRKAPPESDCSWTNLLIMACIAIEDAPRDHVKRIAKVAVRFFMVCTSLDRVKALRLPHEEQKTLLLFSTQMLADYFLTLSYLGHLDPSDWASLFEGISDHYIITMLKDLRAPNANLAPRKALSNLISVARIVHHARPSHPNTLQTMTEYFLSAAKFGKLIPSEDPLPQLGLRYLYVHAATALIQKNPAAKAELEKARKHLVSNFLKNFIASVNPETLEKFKYIFKESLLGADPAVIQQMKTEFNPPSSEFFDELKSLL